MIEKVAIRRNLLLGPSLQVYLKPLIKLKRVMVVDLDDAKSRPLVSESGYRIISASNTPSENRAIEAVTSHLPLTGRLLVHEFCGPGCVLLLFREEQFAVIGQCAGAGR